MEKTLGVETVTLPVQAPKERGHLPRRQTIDLSSGERCKLISVFNSLLHKHTEIVKLRVGGAKYYTVEYSEQLSGHAAAPPAQILPVANFNPEEPLSTEIDQNSVDLALGVSVDGLSTRRSRFSFSLPILSFSFCMEFKNYLTSFMKLISKLENILKTR